LDFTVKSTLTPLLLGILTTTEVEEMNVQPRDWFEPTNDVQGETKSLPDTVTKLPEVATRGVTLTIVFRYESRAETGLEALLMDPPQLSVMLRTRERPEPVGILRIINDELCICIVAVTATAPTRAVVDDDAHVNPAPRTVTVSAGARTRGETEVMVTVCPPQWTRKQERMKRRANLMAIPLRLHRRIK
jgi:hypothetical protein